MSDCALQSIKSFYWLGGENYEIMPCDNPCILPQTAHIITVGLNMIHNYRGCYWLFVTMIFCLSIRVTQCRSRDRMTNNDNKEEGSYWQTFTSVAGKVATSAGDTVYSMFNDDDKANCDEDGCVENDDRTTNGIEKPGGIFNTVTSTVSNAWSSTKEATGAAFDGVRSSIAGEVDVILGAVGNKLATALTPGELIPYDIVHN